MIPKEIKENCPEVSEVLNTPPPFYVKYGTLLTTFSILFLAAVSAFIYVPSERSFDTWFVKHNDTPAVSKLPTGNEIPVEIKIDDYTGVINMSIHQFDALMNGKEGVTVILTSYPTAFVISRISKEAGNPVIRLISDSGQPVILPDRFNGKVTIRFPKRSILQNIIQDYKRS